jgi:Asp-tRNA(Asn)/Glu-tRNA(Gln) amidotransferase A subunit family amidase
VLAQSRPLDQVGVFARSVADAALLAEVIIGFDPGDPDSQPAPAPRLVAAAQAAPPTPPRLAFVRSPVWDKADPATQAAFEALAERLGSQVEAVTLPPPFDEVVAAQQAVMEADLAKSFAIEYTEGKDQLSDTLRGQIERGQKVTAVAYNAAVGLIGAANAALQPIFAAYDALLTPATTGVAPVGEATGSPIFCTLWTFCGTPAITLPLLTGEAGMPLGVQLVAARRDDARLLRTAAWLSAQHTAAIDSAA